jgi:CrcB protein
VVDHGAAAYGRRVADVPLDPDVDLTVPDQRAELRRGTASLLAAVSAGGVLGALARYGVAVAWPHPPGGFAWSTFAVNVAGSALLGVLMVAVTEVWPHRRLLRPFLGVGVLGGFTTFSTYVVDITQAGRPALALAYLAGTLVAALVAVWAGGALAGAAVRAFRLRWAP